MKSTIPATRFYARVSVMQVVHARGSTYLRAGYKKVIDSPYWVKVKKGRAEQMRYGGWLKGMHTTYH